jgi:acetyltransferase EpsM
MEVILAGAGALARVLYDFIFQKYQVFACVDDSPPENGFFENNIPVKKIDEISQYEVLKGKFILTVLNPKGRESVVSRIIEKKGEFLTFIDQMSFVSPSASVGTGCTLLPQSFIMNKACVGNYTHIHFSSIIGHDVVVGEFCSFAPQCVVGGYAEIGKNVTFGMGAKVLPKVKIGNFAIIGAGAVVTSDVPNGATAAGNPAKIIRT